jgi:hypothetical protein
LGGLAGGTTRSGRESRLPAPGDAAAIRCLNAPPTARWRDPELFLNVYSVHIFLAFDDIFLTLVHHTDQLVTLRYWDSCLELDLTKWMVHGIAKHASCL